MKGRVYLVGAGPGIPELLTLKAHRIIAKADVILYDRLVSPSILRYAKPGVKKVYVGKEHDTADETQRRIMRIIIDEARRGKMVVRLKGGDPFLFGRGGEEMEALRTQGIECKVVPGVTSATAAPAAIGIPLTHRKYSSTVAIVTGHEDATKTSSTIDWKKLAHATDTLVILMGMSQLHFIVKRLIDAGLPPTKPVAVIQWATTRKQKSVTGSLGNIISKVDKAKIGSPSVVVVGDVVRLGGAS